MDGAIFLGFFLECHWSEFVHFTIQIRKQVVNISDTLYIHIKSDIRKSWSIAIDCCVKQCTGDV